MKPRNAQNITRLVLQYSSSSLFLIGVLLFAGQIAASTYVSIGYGRNIQSKTSDKKKGEKNGKILLLMEGLSSGRLNDTKTVEGVLYQKLGTDLSVTSISDLNEKDAVRLRQAIQKLQQDRKAGNSIPFAVIVSSMNMVVCF